MRTIHSFEYERFRSPACSPIELIHSDIDIVVQEETDLIGLQKAGKIAFIDNNNYKSGIYNVLLRPISNHICRSFEA
jgi:hypothetical protein